MSLKYFEKSLNNSLRDHLYTNILAGYQDLYLSKTLNNSEEIRNQYNVLCLLKGRELSKKSSISSYLSSSIDNESIKLEKDWIEINKRIGNVF